MQTGFIRAAMPLNVIDALQHFPINRALFA
jgi:hypothetical protein